MKFDLISDFHVEMNNPYKTNADENSKFYPWHLESRSEILVIAGDTSNSPSNTAEVIHEASLFYDQIIFVDGNHDHYLGLKNPEFTVGVNSAFLQNLNHLYNKSITYLNGSSVQINDCLFVGANGWYDWVIGSVGDRDQQYELWKNEMNDSKYIRFDPDGFPDKLAHRQALAMASIVNNAQTDDSIKSIVMVTHTVPHTSALVPYDHVWSKLNGSYMNTEMQRVRDADVTGKISNWVFGHTHFFYDFVADDIRYTTNPRGYRGEQRVQEFSGIIQIDTDD